MASGTSSYSKRTSSQNYAVEQEAIDRTPILGRIGKRTKERPLEPENQGLQLLIPGIPDEITLNHITTQLPWTASHSLPLLGRPWNQAILNRQVHCARVQADSTETLVVVTAAEFIALYSMNSKKFYSLPPIPDVDPCILSECQCLSLDGRVYILGRRENKQPPRFASGSVYVLELVGERKWRKCADMPQPRDSFMCGIIDGKIFVLGGFGDRFTNQSEILVYDPKVNAWSLKMHDPKVNAGSLTMPMDSVNSVAVMRCPMGVVGGVLLLNNETDNSVWEGLILRCRDLNNFYGEDRSDKMLDEVLVLQVYNPVRNDWRVVKTAPRLRDIAEKRRLFVVGDGECYLLTLSAIHRHDTEKNTWTEVHTFSCAAVLELMGQNVYRLGPCSVLAANGELLAIFSCYSRMTRGRESYRANLLQSKGFGGASKVIVWEKVTCSQDLASFHCMCPVQL